MTVACRILSLSAAGDEVAAAALAHTVGADQTRADVAGGRAAAARRAVAAPKVGGVRAYAVERGTVFAVRGVEVAGGFEIFLRVVVPAALNKYAALEEVPLRAAVLLTDRVKYQLSLGISPHIDKLAHLGVVAVGAGTSRTSRQTRCDPTRAPSESRRTPR